MRNYGNKRRKNFTHTKTREQRPQYRNQNIDSDEILPDDNNIDLLPTESDEFDFHWFPSMYNGYCRACRTAFKNNDLIAYNENSEIVGKQCCRGTGEVAENTAVMPTGKTVSDRCPDCFIIHSEGQVDCE